MHYILIDFYQIQYDNVNPIGEGQKVFFQLVIDCADKTSSEEGDFYKARFYVDGKKVIDGLYNKLTWDSFVNKDLNNLTYFEIGRVMQYNQNYYHYSSLNCYALRLYNRGLTKDELEKSYENTVAAHNKLVADSAN